MLMEIVSIADKIGSLIIPLDIKLKQKLTINIFIDVERLNFIQKQKSRQLSYKQNVKTTWIINQIIIKF